MKSAKTPQTVDEYIAGYPEDIQKKLKDIRKTIKKAAPQAVEKIGYRMPSYSFKGMLVYFAVHTNHIGVYPGPSAVDAFKEELADYETSRGTVQFPFKKKIPLHLIAEMVIFRVNENIRKEELKALKKKKVKK